MDILYELFEYTQKNLHIIDMSTQGSKTATGLLCVQNLMTAAQTNSNVISSTVIRKPNDSATCCNLPAAGGVGVNKYT